MSTGRRQQLKWVNGEPVPVDREPLTRKQMAQVNAAVASTPYEPLCDDWGDPFPEELKYQLEDGSWMTKYEAAKLRQAHEASKGNLDALKQIEERELGKPSIQVNAVTITTDMESLLRLVSSAESGYEVPQIPQYMMEIPVNEGETLALPDDYEDAQIITQVRNDEDDDCPV